MRFDAHEGALRLVGLPWSPVRAAAERRVTWVEIALLYFALAAIAASFGVVAKGWQQGAFALAFPWVLAIGYASSAGNLRELYAGKAQYRLPFERVTAAAIVLLLCVVLVKEIRVAHGNAGVAAVDCAALALGEFSWCVPPIVLTVNILGNAVVAGLLIATMKKHRPATRLS
jgi:hypothetical protein